MYRYTPTEDSKYKYCTPIYIFKFVQNKGLSISDLSVSLQS